MGSGTSWKELEQRISEAIKLPRRSGSGGISWRGARGEPFQLRRRGPTRTTFRFQQIANEKRNKRWTWCSISGMWSRKKCRRFLALRKLPWPLPTRSSGMPHSLRTQFCLRVNRLEQCCWTKQPGALEWAADRRRWAGRRAWRCRHLASGIDPEPGMHGQPCLHRPRWRRNVFCGERQEPRKRPFLDKEPPLEEQEGRQRY